jgi:hypothetical protein
MSAEPAIYESKSSQRFRALHKAIGRMGWKTIADNPEPRKSPETPAVAPTSPAAHIPTPITVGEPVQWIPADTMHESALKRAQRLAKIRAERELVFERARMVETVSRLRLRKIEHQVRQSQSAIIAMENRLMSSGHTGRLGWMEAQVARTRHPVTQG